MGWLGLSISPSAWFGYDPTMLSETQSLPEDPAELRDTAQQLVSLVKSQALRIAKLEHQLAGMRRHRFGSRSESLDQLELTLEEEEIAAAKATPPDLPSDTDDAAKEKPKRKPLPANLPRQEQLLSPGESCGDCGGALKVLGEDVTEELDYLPGRFVVNRIVRPRMACKCCETICQAPLPSRPIERGRPGPGLLAHVLISKYADHLPLYRQSQIFEREGIDLDRSTLCDWVGKSTALLEPLADAIGRHVLSGPAIFADDTPLKMQAPGNGRTKTARIWTYVRDERPWLGPDPPAAWYRFTVDRKGQHPAEHLARLRGLDACRRLFRLQRALPFRRHPRGGVHGPYPAQVRRCLPGRGLGHRRGGDQADRRSLCRREGWPRPTARRAGAAAAGPSQADPRRPGELAADPAAADLRQVRACQGHPLRPEPLQEAPALSRPWLPGGGQQFAPKEP